MPTKFLPIRTGGDNVRVKSPFEVESRTKSGSPGSYELSVNFGSCAKSNQPKDKLTIVGLSTEDSPAWRNWNSKSDLIWLEITITNYIAISARIKSWGSNDEFDVDAEAFAKNAYVTDTGIKIALAKIESGVNGNPIITQLFDSNMVLYTGAINGSPTLFPSPGIRSYNASET